MTTLIAACGLDCAQCDAYKATQAGDLLALEAIAAKWTKEFNAPGLNADNIQCDGCMTEGRKIGHCAECQIRLCALERGLPTCAACPDYACQQLSAFLANVPQAKANLEVLRTAG
jgi:hypothetical protein